VNREQKDIVELTLGMPRSEKQLNRLHESDAELIEQSPGKVLAITTDTLIEEIEHGLYTDPHLIGWMAVTCCASDLAAVGASPLGMVISATFQKDYQGIQDIQKGIQEALSSYSLPLLGGDTNYAKGMSFTGTAMGCVENSPPLKRSGAKPGDILASTGFLGIGNLYAYQKLFGKGSEEVVYKPFARLQEGQILRSFASSAIDSSDGFFSSLEDMMGVNGMGFLIESEYEEILYPLIVEKAAIPLPLFLAGHHGEYELVFTVPQDHWHALLEAGNHIGWRPKHIGRVVSTPGIHLKDRVLPFGIIRKTWNDASDNFEAYFNRLIELLV